MLTREQILEIDHYYAEHKMSLEARMDEIGVPHHQYYRWKKKYRDEDAAGIGPEGGSFVQLTPGSAFVPPMMSPARTSGKSSNKVDGAEASFLTIELRTASGTAMVYSLFSSCKAAGIETRVWLEDILVRLPGYKGDLSCLLPGNWR